MVVVLRLHKKVAQKNLSHAINRYAKHFKSFLRKAEKDGTGRAKFFALIAPTTLAVASKILIFISGTRSTIREKSHSSLLLFKI